MQIKTTLLLKVMFSKGDHISLVFLSCTFIFQRERYQERDREKGRRRRRRKRTGWGREESMLVYIRQRINNQNI
jgi:hypothetical protein